MGLAIAIRRFVTGNLSVLLLAPVQKLLVEALHLVLHLLDLALMLFVVVLDLALVRVVIVLGLVFELVQLPLGLLVVIASLLKNLNQLLRILIFMIFYQMAMK